MDFEDRAVIVTGAGRGIGRAIILAFARQKANVAAVDIDGEAAEAVAAEARKGGGRALSFQADVRSFSRSREVTEAIVAEWGRIDVLVNNAGISQPKRFLELTEEEWDNVIAVHLKGAFNWSQAVLPYMLRQQWGRIVNLSSMSAKHGGIFPAVSRTSYAAAKAGILGLTRGLAREAAPYVTVNAICPGVIDTGMAQSLTSGEDRERAIGLIPAGRFGQPEDIAAAVLFLASEEASYITGEAMDVNGGVYID